jgi:hypothetical protein
MNIEDVDTAKIPNGIASCGDIAGRFFVIFMSSFVIFLTNSQVKATILLDAISYSRRWSYVNPLLIMLR